jgi:hypothetical protein
VVSCKRNASSRTGPPSPKPDIFAVEPFHRAIGGQVMPFLKREREVRKTTVIHQVEWNANPTSILGQPANGKSAPGHTERFLAGLDLAV